VVAVSVLTIIAVVSNKAIDGVGYCSYGIAWKYNIVLHGALWLGR